MILYALLLISVLIIKTLFGIIPDLPQPGSEIIAIGDFIKNFIAGGFGFIVHIYTPPITAAIMALVVVLLYFKLGWYPTRWILIKLKIIN